jgi:regulator of sigma E protease
MDIGALWTQWVGPILLLVIGFGLVIFVHELGHFLVAKWAGIRIERFALGFGPRLFGVRRGDTDYCVNLLPLGGYVKMLGQDDFKPLEEGGRPDARSYMAKTPGVRIAVVSAGVVMNVLFAAMLFIIVCLVGIRFEAPVIGGVAQGYPAASAPIEWLESRPSQDAGDAQASTAPADATTAPAAPPAAGLAPGDRVIAIDDDEVTRFSDIAVKAILADPSQVFRVTIEREFQGQTWTGVATVGVRPLAVEETRLGFGLAPASSLILGKARDLRTAGPFEDGDTVVAVAGVPVRTQHDVKAALEGVAKATVPVTVMRGGKPVQLEVAVKLVGGGEELAFSAEGKLHRGLLLEQTDTEYVVLTQDGQTLRLPIGSTVVLPGEQLDILGMSPRIIVEAVERKSPADQAGLLPGDIIVDYADRGTPSLGELNDLSAELTRTEDFKGTTIVVSRDGKTQPPVTISPRVHQRQARLGLMSSPDTRHPVVAAVRQGSPAARAGVREGDVIAALNDKPVESWVSLLAHMRTVEPAQDVKLTLSRGVQTIDVNLGRLSDPTLFAWAGRLKANDTLTPGVKGELSAIEQGLRRRASMFNGSEYSLDLSWGGRQFEVLMGPEVKKSPVEAVVWGVRQTWRFLLMTYDTLRRLVGGTVSHKELRGPVGIGDLAIQVGRERDLTHFMYLMAMISISLAVVNFLPIPVVDGGHVVFLIIEKVRGKPVPVAVLNWAQIAGLVLLLAVFVAVTWQDIVRLIRQNW